MLFITNDKYKIIIIVFPKSGCSTIRLLFTHLYFQDLSNDEKNKILEKYGSIFKKHHSIHTENVNLDKLRKYKVICIYRNTYKRLVSVFLDKICYFKSNMKEKYIPPYNNKKIFTKFIDWIVISKNTKNIDIHFRDQSIPEHILSEIDEFIEISNIQKLFDILPNPLSTRLKKIYDSVGDTNVLYKKFVDYPLDYYDFEKDSKRLFNDNIAPKNYSLFFNNSIIKKINKYYSFEIQLFNIEYPWKRYYTFISNNCLGAALERKYANTNYRNPIMNSLVPEDKSFLKLCKNFDFYMSCTPKIVKKARDDCEWYKQTGSKQWLHYGIEKKDYLIMRLHDIEIHCIHDNNEEKLLEKFERRRKRYQDSIPIFIWPEEYFFQNHSREEREQIISEFKSIDDITIMILRKNLYKITNHYVAYSYEGKPNERNKNGMFVWASKEENKTEEKVRKILEINLNIKL